MNRETSQVICVIVWTLIVCAAPGLAMANYAIESYTIETGGTTSSGGGFVLTGTIELADPSVRVMTGDGYELAGQLCLSVADADGPLAIAADADEEAVALSQCGRGVEEALPLLMIGLVGLYAVARPRARPSAGDRRRACDE